MSVHIAIKKSTGGQKYLSVISVTKDKNGKRVQKVLKSLGNYEKALAADPNIIDKLKAEYNITTPQERAANFIEGISKSISLEKIIAQTEQGERSANCNNVLLNYGYIALRSIWENDLKLTYKLNYLQKSGTKYAGKLDNIAFYMSAIKLIDPMSHYSAYRKRNQFLNDPLSNSKIDDMYNTLTFIDQFKDKIMMHINKRMVEKFGREMSMVFYDCTNVYFETPYDDKQIIFNNIMKYIRDKCPSKIININSINKIAFDPSMIDKALNQLKSITRDEVYFRMRGLSKEHRYDLPLISIALVIDAQGIPIDFEIFPGNTSEFKTMPVVINHMVERYHIKNVIVVADRGLNSITNLSMLVDKNLGFIVAQKVSNLRQPYEKEMLALKSGYRPWDPSIQRDIQENSGLFEDTGLEPDLMFKRIPFTKTGQIIHSDGTHEVKSIDCEIMFTYSRKRRQRDLAQIDNDVALASQAINEKRDMMPVANAGWRSLVNSKKYENTDSCKKNNDSSKDKKDGKTQKREIYRADSLKTDVIEKRRRLAGFAAVVYKNCPDADEAIPDAVLMKSYHQLVRIEECFRIMKNNFSVRPVFVQKHENIRGHIAICVISLILLRILELKLEKSGYRFSLAQIQEALGSTVSAISLTGTEGIFIKNSVASDVFTIENMKARNEEDKKLNSDQRAIRHYLDGDAHRSRPIDHILEVNGLSPLPGVTNAQGLCRCLRLRANYQHLIGSANSAIQTEA